MEQYRYFIDLYLAAIPPLQQETVSKFLSDYLAAKFENNQVVRENPQVFAEVCNLALDLAAIGMIVVEGMTEPSEEPNVFPISLN